MAAATSRGWETACARGLRPQCGQLIVPLLLLERLFCARLSRAWRARPTFGARYVRREGGRETFAFWLLAPSGLLTLASASLWGLGAAPGTLRATPGTRQRGGSGEHHRSVWTFIYKRGGGRESPAADSVAGGPGWGGGGLVVITLKPDPRCFK